MASAAGTAADSAISANSRARTRLTPHIPNAYPRSRSLWSTWRASAPALPSFAPGPTEEANDRLRPPTPGLEEQAPYPASSQHRNLGSRRTGAWVASFFRVGLAEGKMTRDFCARERTFLSWVKASAVLAGLSGVVVLRLKFQKLFESPGFALARLPASPKELRTRRKARRSRQGRHGARLAQLPLLPSLPAQIHVPALPTAALSTGNMGAPSPGVLDSATGSLVVGIVYFILAILALAIGTLDYLQRERALERIDALAREEAERAREHASRTAHGTARPHSVFVPRLADEDIAHARSGKVVNVMTTVLALTVAASALLLLIEEGRIAT